MVVGGRRRGAKEFRNVLHMLGMLTWALMTGMTNGTVLCTFIAHRRTEIWNGIWWAQTTDERLRACKHSGYVATHRDSSCEDAGRCTSHAEARPLVKRLVAYSKVAPSKFLSLGTVSGEKAMMYAEKMICVQRRSAERTKSEESLALYILNSLSFCS